MIDPTPYTSWGPLGAVVFIVVVFVFFMWRRDKEMREFFTGLRAADSAASERLAGVIEKLVQRVESLEDKFSEHNTWERTKLDEMTASQQRNTQPRKRP